LGRIVPNTVASVFALVAGLATFYVSVKVLSAPDTPLDWVVQGCAGLTVAIIIFFLTWGHFQKVGGEE